jgi:hypothetical protein
MVDIKTQSLLYHLTDIANIPSILENGLLSRSQLSDFVDVADGDIIESRKNLGLENYVPFHFFGRNPFDGRVQTDYKDKSFVLITVSRVFAKGNEWKIIPKHPLAEEGIELLSYTEGIDAIDWEKMNARDYSDPESKSVCMAECLSSKTVGVSNFFSIYVNDEHDQLIVLEALKTAGHSKNVNVNSGLFI